MAALGWLINLDFAANASDAVVVAASTNAGSISKHEVDYEYLARLRKQQWTKSYNQAILEDDDEIVALILASYYRSIH